MHLVLNPSVRSIAILLATLSSAVVASASHAQWSSNPALNAAIANKTGDQVQTKIRPTSDGGCYISWLDNNAGGYDTYIQRLNRQGIEQWAHNGVLVADTSFSSTEDYGLVVDANDNAIIAFRDDRSGGQQIACNKISPAGVLLWGNLGVQVSINPNQSHSPHVAALSDGNYVVGWSEGANLRRQKLDSSGAPQWTAGGLFEAPPASNSDLICDVIASDAGNVMISWARNPSRFLNAQKYDTNGAPMWNAGSPVVVFNGSALQFGYFPTFLHDGAGGAIFSWYETGGTRNGYVQRINSAGAEVFPHNGVACSTNTTGRIRISSSVAYSAGTNEIFSYWTDSSSPTQNMWGVYGQKFNGSTGARLWTDTAKELVPLGRNQTAFVTCVADQSGNSMAFWFDQPGSGAHVMGARLDALGNIQWGGSPILVCSTASGKSRLAATISPCNQALVAWGDSRTDGGDIYAQNVKPSGAFGNVARPGDIIVNGFVNVADLLAVINNWGACSACAADVAPIDCPDGNVNVSDLLTVINDWG